TPRRPRRASRRPAPRRKDLQLESPPLPRRYRHHRLEVGSTPLPTIEPCRNPTFSAGSTSLNSAVSHHVRLHMICFRAFQLVRRNDMPLSRRDFIATGVVGSLSLGIEAQEAKQEDSKRSTARTLTGKRPIIVSANNGFNYLDGAFSFLKNGGDTL